jgi:flagellar basal-body rod modification protein FlgD
MTISMASAIGSASAGQSGNIGIQDFLKILTAQLNNQDPLKPVDNQEFVAQIAQFATLEQSRQLNGKIDAMLAAQSSTQSIGLLGKIVDANVGGKLISGRVSALSLASGQPMLAISAGTGAPVEVSLGQILNIR